MISQDVLEATLTTLRTRFEELKADFHDAVMRIDKDMRAAIAHIEADVRATRTSAAEDLRTHSNRIEKILADLRQDIRDGRAADYALRDKIDSVKESLRGKLDAMDQRIARR